MIPHRHDFISELPDPIQADIMGEFRPGDSFGDMGIIDGLPRVSHAVAAKNSRGSVVSKQDFENLCDEYPEIYHQLTRMMCRRVRFLYSLNEDSVGLKLRYDWHVRYTGWLTAMAFAMSSAKSTSRFRTKD